MLYLAEPLDDRPPKSVPDEHSLGAAWVSLDELDRYDFPDGEVAELLRYVAAGGAVYPTSLIQAEC